MLNARQRSIRFGLNYTPSRQWYYCWNDWERRAIAADFEAMASLAIDHVRIQLIWPYFQPNPAFVSPGHLARLGELMRIAEDHGIDVLVTVLTGFLSGYVFLPPGVGRHDVFTSEQVGRSERLLFARVLEAVGRSPNFMGLDLGNELNCLAHDLPTDRGDTWARELLDDLRQVSDRAWLVNGVDHTPWLAGSTFSLGHLVSDYDAVCLHTWPKFSGCLQRGRLDEPVCCLMPAFLTQLARLHAPDPTRPVWLQEIGACDTWGSAAEQEQFMRQAIARAIESGPSWSPGGAATTRPTTLSSPPMSTTTACSARPTVPNPWRGCTAS
jgi:endo-1,4-beta-mannosidase